MESYEKYIKNSKPNLCPQKSRRYLETSDEEKADIFRKHLSSPFKLHYVLHSPIKVDEINTSLNSPLPMTTLPKHISPHEVAYLINKSQKNKSPWYNLITS